MNPPREPHPVDRMSDPRSPSERAAYDEGYAEGWADAEAAGAPLREALKAAPSLRAILNRLGTFNDAWWDRLADEVHAALAATPAPDPLEALHRAMIDAGVVFVSDNRTPFRQRYDVVRALEAHGYPIKKRRARAAAAEDD